MSHWLIFWLVTVIILVVAEVLTVQLVAIWPAIGGIGAMVAASFDQPVWLQFLLFAAVSLVLLVFTRPLVRRLVRQPAPAATNNIERLLGTRAVVTEPVDNAAETGAVNVSGVVWTARAANGAPIPAGAHVVIERCEGTKLFVSAAQAEPRK